MQVESTEGENEYKLWLTPEEYEQLVEHADERSWKHHATVLLGGRVGLRAGEIATMCHDHVWQSEAGDYYLRVPESSGKDTTGSGGRARDAWLPSAVERELLRHRFKSDASDDEPMLGVGQRRVRQMVSELGRSMVDETANSDWGRLSSHDLRRYFAQTLLVRQNVNPHIVMSVGGWDSLDALTPYLSKPTEKQIRDEMVAAGWG